MALVMLVPVFSALVVHTVGTYLGVHGENAALWACSAFATSCLPFIAGMTPVIGGRLGGGVSAARVEILTDRVLTYYLASGVLMAASVRALAMLPFTTGALGWPVEGAILLLVFRKHFFPAEDYLRGRRLLSFRDAAAKARGLLVHGDAGLPWGGLRIPTRHAVLHFVLVGAPGSGKTLSVRILLSEFVSRMVPGAGKRAILGRDGAFSFAEAGLLAA